MGKAKDKGVGDMFKPEQVAEVVPKQEEEAVTKGRKSKDETSGWIKSLRLRRLEDSMYWLNVMSQESGDWYVVQRMAVFAGEDCWDPQAVVLASALQTMFDRKVPDIWNHIYYVNWYLCQCPKFWEVEGGLNVQRALMALEQRYNFDDAEKIIPEPLPSWAIDMHTSVGRDAAAAKDWDKVDRRFGGDEIGSLTKILMFKEYGRLDPADGFECFWKAFRILKERKEDAE